MAYTDKARKQYQEQIEEIRSKGLYKEKRFICSPQDAAITVEYPEGAPKAEVLNFCANNYLGLSSHPEVVKAAHEGLDKRGYGMSSVRFICGTQDIHRELQDRMSKFLGMEDTLLFPSCMDANSGVFEAILEEQDVIIADRLIHASLVDGIRLCSAQYDTFKHMDMKHLKKKLELHSDKRHVLVVTDGVFSMDGDLAPLDEMCDLCDQYGAMILVDDSHASGFIGKTGRGTHEHFNCIDKVDLITTTFGKGLGGASGGCVSGRRELIELCRQKARPYLFSNSMAPPIVNASIKVIDLISKSTELRDKLEWNAAYFRKGVEDAGLCVRPGNTPIVPVMLYNAKLANDMSRDMYAEGIYVIGFFFPVVPAGAARIRVQLSAAHTKEHIDKAVAAFTKVGEKYGILGLDKKGIIDKYGMKTGNPRQGEGNLPLSAGGDNERSQTGQSGPAGPHGIRHDHGAAEHPQRGILSHGHHDPGHGHILRRPCPDNRRHHGVQEGQHIRNNRLHQLRVLLAHTGVHDNEGRSRQGLHGLVPLHVGPSHLLALVRHLQQEQGPPDRVLHPHGSLLAPGNRPLVRNAESLQHHNRDRGHSLRPFRHLPGRRRNPQRGKGQNDPAHGLTPQAETGEKQPGTRRSSAEQHHRRALLNKQRTSTTEQVEQSKQRRTSSAEQAA